MTGYRTRASGTIEDLWDAARRQRSQPRWGRVLAVIVWVLALSAAVPGQQAGGPDSEVSQASARGWTVAGDAAATDAPPHLTVQGPGLRIAAAADASVVAAALACLVRPGGVAALMRGRVSAATATWVPAPAVLTAAGSDRLTIRVSATTATCLVNDRVVTRVPVAPGALDGVPGVYVAAGGDVQVSGFSLEYARWIPSTVAVAPAARARLRRSRRWGHPRIRRRSGSGAGS